MSNLRETPEQAGLTLLRRERGGHVAYLRDDITGHVETWVHRQHGHAGYGLVFGKRPGCWEFCSSFHSGSAV